MSIIFKFPRFWRKAKKDSLMKFLRTMKNKFLTKLAKLKCLKAKSYHESAGKLLVIMELVSQGIMQLYI